MKNLGWLIIGTIWFIILELIFERIINKLDIIIELLQQT